MNGENARTCSISSPKNSTRSGSRPVLGKTSTRPPRTAICPRSSTRSTRSYPANASSSTRASRSRLSACVSRTTSGRSSRRRHALRERARGDADEPARAEHVERARPLADEVRRRLETRAGANATARKERDRGRARRTSRSPRRRRAPPRPRREGRRASARASRAAWREAAEARARRRAHWRGKASANARKRSLAASSWTSPARGVDSRRVDAWSMRRAGTASRGVIVAPALSGAEVGSGGTPGSCGQRRARLRTRQAPPGALPCPF